MRVVFFGSPAPALPSLRGLLERGHAIELVVTQPDKPAGRGRKLTPSPVKRYAVEKGIPAIEPIRIRKDETVLDRIKEARPDIQVVVAYGQIIPGPVIDYPPHRTVNVHFSLLPKFRGAAPVAWTILSGDVESGVTIIRLNEKMDEGDILSQTKTPVGRRETAVELEARLADMGAALLLDTLDRLDTIKPAPQDHARASLAPKIKTEDARLDWQADAAMIDRKVRAMTDRPGAFTFFQGRRIVILKGREAGSVPPGSSPAIVAAVGKEGVSVACAGSTAYLIESLQPEGKKAMTAYAFSLGAKIGPGTAFG